MEGDARLATEIGERAQGRRDIDARPLCAGVVLTRLAGFYTVQLEDGQTIRCVLRGKVRKHKVVLAGDRVRVRLVGPGEGAIEAVMPRTSCLQRPPIANVTRLVVVAALARPDPDLLLTDRLLVVGEAEGLKPVVCLNKADLVEQARAREIADLYAGAGYPTVVTSARTGQGLDELAGWLQGHIGTLTGPSGVGKSALINALSPQAKAPTGELSEKGNRGRHTTRAVRLLPLAGGGLLADTPGFSRLDLAGIEPRRLGHLMPDVRRWSDQCHFRADCLHRSEPGCAVQAAVQRGEIAAVRYRHYLRLLDEVLEMEARRYL